MMQSKRPILIIEDESDLAEIMKDYGKEITAAFVKPVNMDLLLQKIDSLVKS